MIIVLIGTRAQLIKMAPVMTKMEASNLEYLFVLTGQHKNTMMDLVYQFGIKTKPHLIYSGKEVDGIIKVPAWFIICIINFIKFKNNTLSGLINNKHIILVHGDTFSTLLGSILAKLISARLFHVEAGLRSYNLFHPFPEELTRLITFYLSNVSFCPGEFAFNNMAKYKTEQINTVQNTLIDATRHVLNETQKNKEEVNYCVCSIHRFENIFFKHRFLHIISLLKKISRQIEIRFVLHPSTRKRLVKYDLLEELEQNPEFQLMDRMIYTDFIHLLSSAKFVITDGGSNQEELYYMGIPTLLMRRHTERQEGLSSTVLLSNYDEKKIIGFVNDYSRYRQATPLINQKISPSEIIVDYLKKQSCSSQ